MTTTPRAAPERMADIKATGAIGRRMREIARAEGRPAPLQDKPPPADYYSGG